MALPRLSRTAVARIQQFLQDKYAIKRPPVATSALLALIIELHRRHLPFPTRREAAEHVGMSVFGLDGALSVATARGLVRLRVETIEGNVVRRESVVKLRFYDPSPELLAVADRT